MRPPLNRMLLRSLYGDHNEHFIPRKSAWGYVGRPSPHQGWDLAATPGTLAYAIAGGTCIHSQAADCTNDFNPNGKYGRHVILSFEVSGITYYAFYAHLLKVFAKTNHPISEGTPIGQTGQSGNAKDLPIEQAHLHFEIRTRAKTGLGLDGHLNPVWLFPFPSPERACYA